MIRSLFSLYLSFSHDDVTQFGIYMQNRFIYARYWLKNCHHKLNMVPYYIPCIFHMLSYQNVYKCVCLNAFKIVLLFAETTLLCKSKSNFALRTRTMGPWTVGVYSEFSEQLTFAVMPCDPFNLR
jgi:hypothetical protein